MFSLLTYQPINTRNECHSVVMGDDLINCPNLNAGITDHFRVIFAIFFSLRSSRPSPLCRVAASQVSHIYIRLAVGRITGEVIKTGIALLLSLSLNMSHSATLNMRTCRHIILGSESLCLLLDALALSFLAGTIEMQTWGFG